MRTKVFISHATPDDNDFTKWLSLKLIVLGYDVWCDLFYLEKHEENKVQNGGIMIGEQS